MQRLATSFVTALALASGAAAQTVVLDFENLSGFMPMPAGYGGVSDWGSWAHSDLADPNYPAASGVVKILSVGLQQPIVFGQDVVFEGANVVTALPFAWKLYYQGQLVHTSAVLQPNTGGPAVFLASGYTGLVDSMEYDSSVNVHGVDDFTYTLPGGTIGTIFCSPQRINSTGTDGKLEATGSTLVTDNDVTLRAYDLPLQSFGFAIVSRTQGFVPGPTGPQLCLTGQIGRYVGSGQIMNSGTAGEWTLPIDLTQVPQPNGFVTAVAGDTWNFEVWYRDVTPQGTASSEFTTGLEITFQ